jgi:hypothetical protein
LNAAQLSGTVVGHPTKINDSDGIRFVLKAHYPIHSESGRAGHLFVPCGVFDATTEQREILLKGNLSTYNVEICGRLVRTMLEDEKGHNLFHVEIIANPNGLLLQRSRRG